MKATLFALLTSVALFATPVLAGGAVISATPVVEVTTITRDGCTLVQADNGNYFNKADPTCAFTNDFGGRFSVDPEKDDEGDKDH